MNRYPRNAAYSACKGNGFPLVKLDGTLDVPLIEKLARYPVLTLDISPWHSPYSAPRADVILLLRKLNPRIRIGWYHVLGWFWLGADFTSQHRTFADAFHDAVKETGGFLPSNNVNVGNPATEARLTSLFCGAAATGLADFMFFDFYSAVTAASAPAIERLTHAVKQAGGPGFEVIGNGWSADALNAEGSMREGFPDQFANVSFSKVREWRAGRPHRDMDWLQAGTGLTSLDTPEAQRAARFALGTSCLFGTLCSVGPDRDLKVAPSYMSWWMPEYDGGGIGTGWLGEPMGPARQQWFGWRRDFAGGVVMVNDGANYFTATLPKGLCRFDGVEVGTVTVPAMDSVFLVRAR